LWQETQYQSITGGDSPLRKLAATGIAAAALLTASTVAFAQSTSYDISASTSPATAGSTKKPVSTSLTLTVKSTATARPGTASQFKVTFAGMKANTTGLKTCTVASINSAQSDSGCNKAAKIGDGYVKNLVGSADDPNDTSIACNLAVTLYNAGGGKVAVFLKGGPTTTVAGGNCTIGVQQALDGAFKSSGSGVSLSFAIPANLQHPITGLNQGISEIQTTIDKKTVKIKGKKRGLLEAVGGCKSGSRAVTLDLTGVGTSSGSAKC
jgi:hypothetical protein